jgi:hypothetical protein
MRKNRGTQPEQFTDVLMLPVDVGRAEELGRQVGDPAPTLLEAPEESALELVLGIAAIEDAEQRQGAALAAAMGIYGQTRHCAESLARYMAEYYGKDAPE